MRDVRPLVVIDARGYFTGGGIGRYTRGLVRELIASPARRVGLRLLISHQHRPGDLDLPDGVDDARRGPVDVRVSRAGWMVANEEDLWLEDEVTDASLFHSLTGHWLPAGDAAFACDQRAIATVHDLTPVVRPRIVGIEARRFGQRVAATVVRASHLIVDSHATARDVRAVLGGRMPTMEIIPAAAASNFRPGAPILDALTRHGLESDGFLLSVSVLSPHKNLVRLVDAYAASGVRVPLIVVGSHRDDTGRIQAAIARHRVGDRVRLIGRVPDQALAALYASCRAFVYPSHYEGFGLPVVEAMACGAAVVASRTSSIPEVAGDAALLVDAGRTRSLSAALRRVDHDAGLRQTLRRRAIVRAASFSWARAAAATLRVYDNVLEARAA